MAWVCPVPLNTQHYERFSDATSEPELVFVFDKITAAREYSAFSLEELRLNDYKYNRGVCAKSPNNNFT